QRQQQQQQQRRPPQRLRRLRQRRLRRRPPQRLRRLRQRRLRRRRRQQQPSSFQPNVPVTQLLQIRLEILDIRLHRCVTRVHLVRQVSG
ncbi:unnamed protein product, partial [Rotaria magnacalcarata]